MHIYKRRTAIIASITVIFSLCMIPEGNSGWQDLFRWNKNPAKAADKDTPKPEAVKAMHIEEPSPIGLTLSDCYTLALKQSELIAINGELIKVTEAHFLQALSIMLPHASFISIDNQQQTPDSTSGSSANDFSSSKKSSERGINVTQTLFNGFKAFAAISGSGYERKQRINEKERAEQLLFVDVANVFYLLKENRTNLKALAKTETSLLDRVKELRDREKLGRSRPSEVVNAKTQLYGVEAQIEFQKSQVALSKELLEFLVGIPVDELIDTHDIPSLIHTEDYYVSKAIFRPDVEAAKDAWKLAKEAVIVAESDFMPDVSLETNYYTQRTNPLKGTDWDVTLVVSVPIFEGTEVLGNVKAAESKARQNKLLLERNQRSAPKDIRDAYVKFKAAIAVHGVLKKAYTTAKLNYHLQKKDYRMSLVNNLDVLTAIRSLRDAEIEYIHALYEAKRLYWQLLVACGEEMREVAYDTF